MSQSLIWCLSVFGGTTVPESIVVVILSFAFLGRFDLLDKFNMKKTIKYILIPTIPSALLLNILIYVVKVPSGFAKLLSFIILYFSIYYIIKKTNTQNIIRLELKLLGILASSFVIIGILETIHLAVLIIFTHVEFSVIATDMKLFLLSSIPLRVVQIIITAILVLFLSSRNNKNLNIFKVVLKNKTLLNTLVFNCIFTILEILYIVYLILWKNILFNMNTIDQLLFILVFIFVIPSILIFWTCYFVVYFNKQEKSLQQLYHPIDID